MNNNSNNCQEYQLLMMKALDGEISAAEEKQLFQHLQQCSRCNEEFHQLKKIKGVTSEMKSRILPEMAWDEYWRHLYNRLERGLAWVFISIGAIILLGLAVYHFVESILHSTEITGLEKAAILMLAVGAVILFVSVVREKLMVRKYDKYREVKR